MPGAVTEVLAPGERVIDISPGQRKRTEVLVALTDRRLLVLSASGFLLENVGPPASVSHQLLSSGGGNLILERDGKVLTLTGVGSGFLRSLYNHLPGGIKGPPVMYVPEDHPEPARRAVPTERPGPHPTGSRARSEYAGFWIRTGAMLIDAVIIGIASFIVAFGIGIVFGVTNTGRATETTSFEVAMNVVGFIAQWLYYAFMESSREQATLGKKALGLRVTDLDGKQISFWRATGRYFGKIVSTLILLIGYLMVIWTRRKQALHDMMAGTLILRS